MKFLFHFFILLFIIYHSPTSLRAQEAGVVSSKNTISVGIGHTMVAKGVKDGSKKWLALPSWAIDYNHRLSEKWAIGLQNEIIVTDFEVETLGKGEEIIARSRPFSSIAMVGYFPWEEVMVFIGGGAEMAAEENFAMLRVGAEPSLGINEHFELITSLVYDFKIEGYDSFGLSFGIGYKF